MASSRIYTAGLLWEVSEFGQSEAMEWPTLFFKVLEVVEIIVSLPYQEGLIAE